ncbi:hypothetical protein PROFUN_15413 [Planoprotostelium fungivorum]|uniref:Uncharacterized protein n=1 Tax=Planoprotostelium fungivorum TaxID=1890364 RepID=A0A2P6MVZ7_9EUKA|nr:hypothetical protein PROFUN_15413 [Planoprotostelium fungivorum]
MAHSIQISVFVFLCITLPCFSSEDYGVTGCEGYVQVASSAASSASTKELDYSAIKVKLSSSTGVVKDQTECAPNGYYFLPITEKGLFTISVDGPAGWSFEPVQRTVSIGKDGQCLPVGEGSASASEIDFEFIGFSVVGQVTAPGCSSAADLSGVKVTLRQAGEKEQLGQTTTDKDGSFRISKLFPGKYIIEASHSSWTFTSKEIPLEIHWDNVALDRHIEISGYDVIGKIDTDAAASQPMTLQLKHASDPTKPFRTCQSDSQGNFRFTDVSCGSYVVSPSLDKTSGNFRISPDSIPIQVQGGTLTLPKRFQLAGFSLQGSVRTAWGKPIHDATVKISFNDLTVLTDRNGSFALEDMKNGKYRVTVTKEGYHFDAVDVYASSSSPVLSDITPTGVDICGQLSTQDSTASNPFKLHLTSGGSRIATTKVDQKGNFCFRGVEAGKKPEGRGASIEVENNGGNVVFHVQRHDLIIRDEPIEHIHFSESKLHISGQVKKLSDSSEGLTVLLKQGKHIRETHTDAVDEFHFDNTPPGSYDLEILSHSDSQPCWDQSTIHVVVQSKNITDIVFQQKGYRIDISSSHPAKVRYSLSNDKAKEVSLSKGLNSFCVNRPGIYQLDVVSCFKFEADRYTYDTKEGGVKELKVKEYILEGQIRKEGEGVDSIILYIDGLQSRNVTATPDGLNSYHYTTSVTGGERVKITPSSDGDKIFYPEEIVYQTPEHSEECLTSPPTFVMRPGHFIVGSVEPPTEGVTIIVVDKEEEEKKRTGLTDSEGKFRVGPMRKEKRVEVRAEKKGYDIHPKVTPLTLVDSQHRLTFNAAILARLDVDITDGEKAIAGVLISLSGQGFRAQNNITSNSTFTFWSLRPNQYFLRPLLKEYTFNPTNAHIKLKDGEHKTVTLTGKRVSFSAYGTLKSINGLNVSGLTVEALSHPHIEEAVSDDHGHFRVRGLLPGKAYTLRVKGDTHTDTALRTVPALYKVDAKQEDLRDLDFIVHRFPISHDITGQVGGDDTQKVNLVRANGQMVESRNIGPTKFFRFEGLTKGAYLLEAVHRNGAKYQQRVSLQQSTHVQLDPVFTQEDLVLEGSLTSFSSIIFVLFVIVVVANYEKIAQLPKKWKTPTAAPKGENSWLPKNLVDNKVKTR